MEVQRQRLILSVKVSLLSGLALFAGCAVVQRTSEVIIQEIEREIVDEIRDADNHDTPAPRPSPAPSPSPSPSPLPERDQDNDHDTSDGVGRRILDGIIDGGAAGGFIPGLHSHSEVPQAGGFWESVNGSLQGISADTRESIERAARRVAQRLELDQFGNSSAQERKALAIAKRVLDANKASDSASFACLYVALAHYNHSQPHVAQLIEVVETRCGFDLRGALSKGE